MYGYAIAFVSLGDELILNPSHRGIDLYAPHPHPMCFRDPLFDPLCRLLMVFLCPMSVHHPGISVQRRGNNWTIVG